MKQVRSSDVGRFTVCFGDELCVPLTDMMSVSAGSQNLCEGEGESKGLMVPCKGKPIPNVLRPRDFDATEVCADDTCQSGKINFGQFMRQLSEYNRVIRNPNRPLSAMMFGEESGGTGIEAQPQARPQAQAQPQAQPSPQPNLDQEVKQQAVSSTAPDSSMFSGW